MIHIRPIRTEEIHDAKLVIAKVGYGIFGWDGTLEESIQYFLSSDAFKDMDDLEGEYFQRNGLFLAVLEDEMLIGSGAIRRIDEKIAELKRMWLLEAYHGKGIGFQLLQQLFDFAQGRGYERVWLQTSPQQKRAIDFYKKVGFYEIPCYNDDIGEVSMEILLAGTKNVTNSSSFQ